MLVRRPKLVLLAPALFAIALGAATPALAQFGPPGPPAVGVVKAQKQPITETSEFVGRVQALDKVDLLARVTGTLVERLFTEGAEVKQGDVQRVRALLERATSLSLPPKKMKFLFRRWLEFERRSGDEASVALVKQRALEFVQAHAD